MKLAEIHFVQTIRPPGPKGAVTETAFCLAHDYDIDYDAGLGLATIKSKRYPDRPPAYAPAAQIRWMWGLGHVKPANDVIVGNEAIPVLPPVTGAMLPLPDVGDLMERIKATPEERVVPKAIHWKTREKMAREAAEARNAPRMIGEDPKGETAPIE